MERVKNNLILGDNELNSVSSVANNGGDFEVNMNVNDIQDVELMYSILSCYRFLSFRFPTFVDYQKCEQMLRTTANMIQQGFDDVTIRNKYHYQQQRLTQ